MLTVLKLLVGTAFSIANVADGTWWPRAELENAGMPTVFAKAARLVLAGAHEA